MTDIDTKAVYAAVLAAKAEREAADHLRPGAMTGSQLRQHLADGHGHVLVWDANYAALTDAHECAHLDAPEKPVLVDRHRVDEAHTIGLKLAGKREENDRIVGLFVAAGLPTAAALVELTRP